MRILVAHNAYQQRGGEDSVVDAEVEMLRLRGNEVATYFRHNDELHAMGRLAAARQAVWSSRSMADMRRKFAEFRPDVLHVHNTFPLISPSVYAIARSAGVPVVQTMHNFRLFCPQAMLLRNGRVCEECVGKVPWRSVLHGCYRQSRMQTSVLAGMLSVHRLRGTYSQDVTRFIALNEFCRDKFVAAGMPAQQISVKPNFVDVPRVDAPLRSGGIFVGRLSPEKGVQVLAEAIRKTPQVNLTVVGEGPEVRRLAGVGGIECVGFLARAQIFDHLRAAAYLVMPSIWYETFGLVAIEAFACETPVIASRLGAMAEIVRDGETGLLFEPGSSDDLAEKLAWAEAHPQAMREMGLRARLVYEQLYTSAQNYGRLISIYDQAIEECRRRRT